MHGWAKRWVEAIKIHLSLPEKLSKRASVKVAARTLLSPFSFHFAASKRSSERRNVAGFYAALP
jgi:hypothetical protein